MVGALNLISVAFAVLFVGLGVDFGIQFAVRYRSERIQARRPLFGAGQHRREGRRAADARGGRDRGGLPVVFPDRLQGRLRTRPDRRHRHADRLSHQRHRAAGAAHHPASARRRGADRVRRAGAGRPVPGTPPHCGDRRHHPGGGRRDRRCSIISASISIRSICEARPSSRSRRSSTCGTIRRSAPTPSTCWCRSPATSTDVADRLSKIPEVDKVTTIAEFVPDGQDRKLTLIRGLARQLQTPLSTEDTARPPTDAQNVAALQGSADALTKQPSKASGPAPTRPIVWPRT